MIYAIYFIWTHQDEIITLGYRMFSSSRLVEIKESNEYKRYYNYVAYSTEEKFEPNSKEDLQNIVFNILNNGWETFTFYCTNKYTDCLDDVKEISNDSSLLSSINNYVNPFNSFTNIHTKVSSDGSVTLNIIKTYNDQMKKEINEEIDAVFKKLKIDGSPSKKNIKKLHDYVINTFEYDKSENYEEQKSSTAYALITHKAICSGYADTMALFLDRLNIPNLKVASKDHIWNLIYIDGTWLHLDATWDDPVNAITNDHKYDFYLIDTEKLLEQDTKEHTFNELYYLELKKA